MGLFGKYSAMLALLPLAQFCGCATRHVVQFSNHTADEPVRAVIFKGAQENTALAERARTIGNESYPQILQLLGEKPSEAPAHFDIVFQNHASTKTLTGGTSGGFMKRGTIYLGLDWLTNSPQELDSYLVHEVAHVAQNYQWRKTPPHWSEGLADYAHFKLGYTNSWACAECSALCPHYASGYICAAAFLFFVEANHDAQIAIELNRALRNRTYSDEFFKKMTRQSLEELWKEFKCTPSFTPSAADILKLEESLGYVNGRPTRRLTTAERRKFARERALATLSERPGDAAIADAYRFMERLHDNDQLPGWRKDELGKTRLLLNNAELGKSPNFPFRFTVEAAKDADGLVYHYTVTRESPGADWKLEKSWCTDKNNRFIRDL